MGCSMACLFWVSFVNVVALGGFVVFFTSLCIDVARLVLDFTFNKI